MEVFHRRPSARNLFFATDRYAVGYRCWGVSRMHKYRVVGATLWMVAHLK